MLQFKNETPFKGTIYLLPDQQGVDTLYAVVKATFALGDRLSIAAEQVPVTLADEYYGEPGQSSIKVPSDVSLVKPGTDVLLIGHAHAPGGRPTTQVDVGLAVGPVRKAVRVFGDRTWDSGALGGSMTPPAGFVTMPLVWERSFGGTDRKSGQPTAEVRNPVGAGFHAKRGEKAPDGVKLPNLEDLGELITSWKQTPTPVGFAPICAHWQPRVAYAGTYDEAWQKGRAPYLPKDFDSRFCQLAPAGQVVPGYLRGGEPVEVRGVTPSGVLRFALPTVPLAIMFVLDGSGQEQPANLDTVVIEPDLNRLVLVWRASLACDKKALRVSEIRAFPRKAA